MSNHDDVNDAFAQRLTARSIRERLVLFLANEWLVFGVQGRGYFKALPRRLVASASRALPWIAVTAAACVLVSCAV